MNMIHSSSILCIVWFIKQILGYNPFQTYLWFFALNFFTMFVWYFSHNPKKHFTKLVNIMETKGNKNLHNIKILKWMFMINPIKCVLFGYHTFFMKMALDVAQTLYLIWFFFFHWHENIVGVEWSDAIVRGSALFELFFTIGGCFCLWCHNDNQKISRGCILHVLQQLVFFLRWCVH